MTTTASPACPSAGVNPAMRGSSLKLVVLAPVPAEFVTLIGPVCARPREPSATSRSPRWCVTVTGPVNVTAVVPSKLVPPMVTSAPTVPEVGVSEVTCGGWMTTSGAALVAVASIVVTPIGPVTAPSGTRSWISVAVAVATEAGGIVNAPIFTTGAPLAASRLVPVTLTTVWLPAAALDGANPVILGWTLNTPAVVPVPTGLVTRTTPVSARAGRSPSPRSRSPRSA